MPYTIPTATEFKTRHVAFANVADSYIDAVLVDASRFVDDSWFEPDYQPALMFLAAHMMVGEGALGGDPNTTGLISSEKLGDASISYGTLNSFSVSDYGSTSYGRRFFTLLRVNQPAVAIT